MSLVRTHSAAFGRDQIIHYRDAEETERGEGHRGACLHGASDWPLPKDRPATSSVEQSTPRSAHCLPRPKGGTSLRGQKSSRRKKTLDLARLFQSEFTDCC